MQYDLCLIVNLHSKQHFLHKHFHSIYFKHAHISQLSDFIAIQQLRDVCVFEINGMEVFM